MTTSVALAGACGKMGVNIIKKICEESDIKLVCALESPNSPSVGKDAGEVAGMGKIGIAVVPSSSLSEALEKSKPQVFIDFTNASAAVENIKVAAKAGINLVVGTTGFTKEQMEEIKKTVKNCEVAAVISPNMATGVNIFFKVAEEAAKKLGKKYDIEIVEAHHKFKKDAPSGTALRAGEILAGAAKRELKEIKFHSIRAGDIVGDHTVVFAGEGERLEITHRAHSREAFASGVIRAVRFVDGKKEGVYSSWDVLEI